MINFYLSPEGGKLSMKEAIQRADKEMNGPEFERRLSIVGSFNVNQVSWFTLHDFFLTDPDLAEQIWQDIKEEAAKDFIGGHMVAQVFEGAEWQRTPWKRAQFIAVRDSYIKQFRPQGGIDYTMIDMLATFYFLWMHWTEEHMRRSTTDPRYESGEFLDWKRRNCKKDAKQWDGGLFGSRLLQQTYCFQVPFVCRAFSAG